MGSKPNWSEADKQLILDNMTMPIKVLAEKLNRTPVSVTCMKYRLQNDTTSTRMRKRYGQDFDDRPSGWYEETIGALLMEDEDAFASWRHYHRYVELEYAGEVPERITMWVTLRCRRDADAP